MKKNRLWVVFIAFIFCSGTFAQNKVVGYATSWQGDVNSYRYRCLTHVNYSFAIPTRDGGLEPIENEGKLKKLEELGHAAGIKVLIAVGGWDLGDGGGNDSRFNQLASTAQGRANFVKNVMEFIEKYKLDGVDIDWEYPEGASGANFTKLMKELSAALKPKGLLLSAAVAAHGSNAAGVSTEVFGVVDFLNLMAYDGGNGANHSPYSYAQTAVNYWSGRGLSKNKLVIGVPFYSRPGWKSYAELLAAGADENADSFNGDHYNGIPTIKRKSQLGISSGSGVMIWEIGHDVTGDKGLLKAIGDVVLPGCDLLDDIKNKESVLNGLKARPNPFIDDLKIDFTIKEMEKVKLEIFDGTGKRISFLENRVLLPGDYSYRLGVKVKKGIYFYKITTNSNTFTKKVVKM